MKKQKGMSLSEMLISLFLASMIIIILIQLYLGSKSQYIEMEKILTSGLEMQWVRDLLSNSIRRAGFTPCLGIDQLQLVDLRKNQNLIRSLSVSNLPHPSILIYRMNEDFAKLIKIQNETEIIVQNLSDIHVNRPIIITDCIHAEIHQLDHVEQKKHQLLLILSEPLVFSYDESTYVGELIKENWFIKHNKKGKASLYYQSVQTEEITPLIHSLYIANKWIKNKRFLEVDWILDEGKIQKMRVAVRGS